MERLWLREIRGYTSQAEIAHACDISQQLYSAIEVGKSRPSVETAKKIADILGFPWTRFYEDEAPKAQ